MRLIGAWNLALVAALPLTPEPTAATTSKEQTRLWTGVDLARRPAYALNSAKTFRCADAQGQAVELPWSAVNDNYCDCADGTDEPGTSACANGRFTCLNEGFRPATISSTRVNDGVCEDECCDGSDEWATDAHCPNVCAQRAAEHARAAAERAAVEAQAQNQLTAYLRTAGEHVAANADRRNIVAPQLESARVALEAAERASEAANAAAAAAAPQKASPGRRGCAAERAALEDANDAVAGLRVALEQFGADMEVLRGDPEFGKTDRVKALLGAWEQVRNALDDMPLELLPHDLVEDASVEDASEEPVEEPPRQTVAQTAIANICADPAGSLLDCYRSLPGQLWTFTQNLMIATYSHPVWTKTLGAFWQESFSDTSLGGAPSEPPIATPAPAEHTTGDADESGKVADATEAAAALTAARDRVAELERDLAEVDDFEKTDFGPHSIWSAVDGEKISFNNGEYTYEVEFHGKAVQRSNADGRTTTLGDWSRFGSRSEAEPAAEKYHHFLYLNGDQCWNGPRRSLEVRISCGAEHKALAVSEPSKCEYVMDIISPLGCTLPSV